MIRPRGGTTAASSRATAQTLCQKCLKRDNYECKASTQERPYISRPSRTQQLSNPKLVPKLTSDVPNELLRKQGIADEELARKEAERNADRDRYGGRYTNGSRKRSRSLSSSSSTSVSTISTAISHIPSPTNGAKGRTGQSQRMSNLEVDRKRRRSTSSCSHRSGSSRNPPQPHCEVKHHRAFSRDGRPRSSSSSGRRRGPRSPSADRGKRRRRASRSPVARGRHRDSHTLRDDPRSKSFSFSRNRSQVARNRKSMTPGIPSRPPESTAHGRRRPSTERHSGYSDDHERYGGSARTRNGDASATSSASLRRQAPRERSLSPFSKRLALTQAMNKR